MPNTEDDPEPLKPLNAEALPARQTAVALKDRSLLGKTPEITAAGRGEVARQILEIAHKNGVKVREDANLAELLAMFEIDSPIPTEALMAVGEILAYVYQANGEPNPFDAVLKEEMENARRADIDSNPS
ncbi:MAG: EscU/YscU/HrcU family type III secretion system export apparatus switch protein [Rhodospirillales bacterium]|nr:EscU/YscU/HrcU family type III secretion system export apparatus switch protein [Alphaproteobacteria bacterium]MCB9987154.1 EscU/YscU/HrcU family type III secretion system export apparatus switch protein [Rhodospirillales bacterium]USO08089.1 MAG: EscU/YscU/HrcU family type III secretion system export apparatus switch protein [Rhodospirillales bacterium]